MSDGFLVFYFVLIGLVPSLLVALRVEKFMNKAKSLEEAGASQRRASAQWMLPVFALPAAWAALCIYLTFNPKPEEIAPLFLLAIMSSCVTLGVGALVRPACRLVRCGFEAADKWLYSRFP